MLFGRGQSREFAEDVQADREARAGRGGVAAAAMFCGALFLIGYFIGIHFGWWGR